MKVVTHSRELPEARWYVFAHKNHPKKNINTVMTADSIGEARYIAREETKRDFNQTVVVHDAKPPIEHMRADRVQWYFKEPHEMFIQPELPKPIRKGSRS